MSKRISKRMREEAADLCAMMASSNSELMTRIVNGWPEQAVDFEDACGADVCYASDGVADLARAAFQTGALHWYPEPRAPWAEAEALLRTGWRPHRPRPKRHEGREQHNADIEEGQP